MNRVFRLWVAALLALAPPPAEASGNTMPVTGIAEELASHVMEPRIWTLSPVADGFTRSTGFGAIEAAVDEDTSITLTASDTQPCAPCVTGLTPSSIDLLAPPATFTIDGGGFVDKGFGPPVVKFTRVGVLLGQARANSLIGSTTLIVPIPTDATSLTGPLPGLSAGGAVLVQVYNQTGPTSYLLVSSAALTIQDSRPPAAVTSIAPESFDLANPLPATFAIAGQRFSDSGFGAPMVNLTRGGVLL